MNRLCLNERYCKGCLICVAACPTGALQLAIAREVPFSETGAQLGAF